MWIKLTVNRHCEGFSPKQSKNEIASSAFGLLAMTRIVDNLMKLDDVLKNIRDRFGSKALKVEKKSESRAYIDIDPKDLVEFAIYIFKDLKLRFNIATAVDDFDAIEMLYHFADDPGGYVISLRAMIKDKEDPHIDTITHVTKSAWWIEREIHELFGVHFNGNADLRQLLLPDDWPQGVYPLRKNFVVPRRDSRKA
ncbi:MAG: NADH-quinone oxidoreductase subunit C [Candidatus Omnitrophota bacterium]|nr:NADH-quinone oxidoreductase subunit C [Candidatus Omnitrophota bacterium]